MEQFGRFSFNELNLDRTKSQQTDCMMHLSSEQNKLIEIHKMVRMWLKKTCKEI